MRRIGSTDWVTLLAGMIPPEPECHLLRFMLWNGEAAREQWSKWSRLVGDPKNYFEHEYVGRKGLLAFIARRVSENEVEVGADFATYVRVACVREELRGRIFTDSLDSVQDSMNRSGLHPVLLNGAAYAYTVYSDPLVRHNHGIDLWLPAEEMRSAEAAVGAAGFRLKARARMSCAELVTFEHSSGLELTLRPRLFLAPHVEEDQLELRGRCRGARAGRTTLTVLHPVDRLCHTFGEGAAAPTRGNLRWVCDAYLLLERADFDFAELTAAAVKLGTAAPTALLLEFMRAQLDAPVPVETVLELRERCLPRSRNGSKLLLSAGLRSSSSATTFVGRAEPGSALFVAALLFALFPSAQHIAYQRRAGATTIPAVWYVFRAVRFLLRPLRAVRRWRRRSRRLAPRGAAKTARMAGGRPRA